MHDPMARLDRYQIKGVCTSLVWMFSGCEEETNPSGSHPTLANACLQPHHNDAISFTDHLSSTPDFRGRLSFHHRIQRGQLPVMSGCLS
jgi:hypothetical protein